MPITPGTRPVQTNLYCAFQGAGVEAPLTTASVRPAPLMPAAQEVLRRLRRFSSSLSAHRKLPSMRVQSIRSMAAAAVK
jgi:hypothetical protein